jgi:Na+-translocating ferredoxin:NAD+ oxidoreductase RnfD subunit
MKTRVVQNWRSSLLGLALLILAAVLLWKKVITFSEFTAFLPTVFALLYIKDGSLKKP